MEKDLCKDWAVNIKLKQENSKIQCYIAQKDLINNKNGCTRFQNLGEKKDSECPHWKEMIDRYM